MNRHRIPAVFAASLLYFAALYLYVPTLPAWVEGRTSSLTAVGVVLAMYGLWMAVLRMPLGVVTDATGNAKPWVIGGVLMAGAGAAVMALGSSAGMLAVGRALTGVSAAAWVPLMVVFAGFFPREKTVFATSLLSMASSLGQMIATACTGFVEAWGGFTMAFWGAAALSVLAAVIIALVRIPRADSAHRGAVTPSSILSIFRRRDVLVPSFTNALCQFGVWALTFGFMPLLARRLGAGSVAVGLIMTLNIAAGTAANLLATLVAGRGNRKLLLYGSFALFAVGAAAAALAGGVPLLFVSTVLMGLAGGTFFPILLGMSIEGVDAAHRSTAMGIHQAVYAVGMFAGPWIGGILADAIGIQGMFWIAAVFSLAAPGAILSLWREPRAAHAAAAQRRKQASQETP